VKTFSLSFSVDGKSWVDGGRWNGNCDNNNIALNILPLGPNGNAPSGRFVRVFPTSYVGDRPRMRVGVMPVAGTLRYPIPKSVEPPNFSAPGYCAGSLSASSQWNSSCAAVGATVGASHAWCTGSLSNPNDYLQLYLGSSRTVTTIYTQGRPGGFQQYVTSYYVQYSQDGLAWTQYQALFDGNHDTDTINGNEVHIEAPYLRLIPVGYVGWKSLRLCVQASPIALAYVPPKSIFNLFTPSPTPTPAPSSPKYY